MDQLGSWRSRAAPHPSTSPATLRAFERHLEFLAAPGDSAPPAGGVEAGGRHLGPSYPYRSGCEPGQRCSSILLSKHPLRSVRRPDVLPGPPCFVIAEGDVRGRGV